MSSFAPLCLRASPSLCLPLCLSVSPCVCVPSYLCQHNVFFLKNYFLNLFYMISFENRCLMCVIAYRATPVYPSNSAPNSPACVCVQLCGSACPSKFQSWFCLTFPLMCLPASAPLCRAQHPLTHSKAPSHLSWPWPNGKPRCSD